MNEVDAAIPDFSMWTDDIFEQIESENVGKTMQCIKTQKRRELMMKKHRRAKRKKHMLLKLKSTGKI